MVRGPVIGTTPVGELGRDAQAVVPSEGEVLHHGNDPPVAGLLHVTQIVGGVS
jgi:hypothetical protein